MKMAPHFVMGIVTILMNISISKTTMAMDRSTCDGDCDDNDPSGDTLDVDGDGQTTCDGDCDDFDPNVYLGQPLSKIQKPV